MRYLLFITKYHRTARLRVHAWKAKLVKEETLFYSYDDERLTTIFQSDFLPFNFVLLSTDDHEKKMVLAWPKPF